MGDTVCQFDLIALRKALGSPPKPYRSSRRKPFGTCEEGRGINLPARQNGLKMFSIYVLRVNADKDITCSLEVENLEIITLHLVVFREKI